jgi:hypothetical protein
VEQITDISSARGFTWPVNPRAQLLGFTQTVEIVTSFLSLARVGLPRWRVVLPSPYLFLFCFLFVFKSSRTFVQTFWNCGTTCSTNCGTTAPKRSPDHGPARHTLCPSRAQVDARHAQSFCVRHSSVRLPRRGHVRLYPVKWHRQRVLNHTRQSPYKTRARACHGRRRSRRSPTAGRPPPSRASPSSSPRTLASRTCTALMNHFQTSKS